MTPENLEILTQACDAVFQWLGPHHSEKTYQNALRVELGDPSISSEEMVPIFYKNIYVGFQRIDLSWKNIIIEIKAVIATGQRERGQCLRYRKITGRPVVLVNFSPDGMNLQVFDAMEQAA